MNTFDDKKLEEMVAGNRFDEARAYIESFLMATSTDGADTAIDYAHLYMNAMSKINGRYLASLRNTQALLRNINSAQSRGEDLLSVAKLKAELRG